MRGPMSVSSSKGSPTRIPVTAGSIDERNSSKTSLWTGFSAFLGVAPPRHDALADRRRACEGDLGDVGVLYEPFPHLAPRTHDDVDHALRDAGLQRYAPELQCRKRRELGRLEDQRVAGGERRRHLPARYGEREVPRDDEPDDPEGFAERHVYAPRDRYGVAEQPLGHPRIVVEGLRDHPHLAAGIADWFARVPRLELRQVLLFRVERVGEAPEQTRTVGRLYISPRRESFPGAGYGRVCVVLGGRFQPLQHVFGR